MATPKHDPRYDPNTRHWNIGDFVIHSIDYKADYMLMVITGYTREGLAKTRYIKPHPKMSKRDLRRVWVNDIKWLLDPAKFGIPLPTDKDGKE